MRKINYIHQGVIRACRKYFDLQAKRKIQKNNGLWTVLDDYLKKSGSTGCSFSDYYVLYSYVRKQKPIEVLECATGVSTIVMGYAMMENEKESGVAGKITSMEESEKYYDIANRLLPPVLNKYIELILSPKVDAYYYFFRGEKYQNVPCRAYDFVFIDGPTTKSIFDGQKTFDFDFIDVVLKSEKPVSAVVDGRLSTCYVLNKVLGKNKFKYDHIRSLGFVRPCTKNDLLTTNEIVNTYRDIN